MRIVIASVLLAGVAQAQLPIDQQKCIDKYNNALRKVGQQAGKSARTCIANAAKGSEPDPETCVVANTDGKLAGKEQKVADLFASGGACAPLPPVIVQAIPAGTAAARGGVDDLIHDFFATPIGAISTAAGDRKCLDAAVQRSTQVYTALLKAQRKCKKAVLRGGSVIDESGLTAACGTLAQIDQSGAVGKRLSKLDGDVQDRCAATSSGLPALFDGLDPACHAGAAALSGCLQARTRCRACEALNGADGLAMDCDLFDDAAANFSCAGAVALGSHACTLAASSELLFLGPLPLSITPTGSLTISCGTTDGDAAASCTCALAALTGFVLPAIGDVCVNPAPGCAAGQIDCNGGPALDTEYVADHDIGPCTGNADCASACDAHCAGLGAEFTQTTSSCEGFCQGGTNADAACAADSDCPGGQCANALHGACNCACTGRGLGGASGAGDLSCNLGLQVDVELPADGDCNDANAYSMPPVCTAMTTTAAVGELVNANATPSSTLPGGGPSTVSGAGVDCYDLAASTTSGMSLVGHFAWFDTTLGDLFATATLDCN